MNLSDNLLLPVFKTEDYMSWDLDTPNLYFKKPRQITELENLSAQQREAMDPIEIGERVLAAANSLAEGYKKQSPKADFEGCILVVSTALAETGGSLGGKMGATMVGISQKTAEQACRESFPEPGEL